MPYAAPAPPPSAADPFENWALRDAAFRRLVVDWERGTCRLELRGSIVDGERPGPWAVVWSELQRVSVTREPPFAADEAVCRHWQVGATLYVIEMRHGGCVQVDAGSVALRPGDGA